MPVNLKYCLDSERLESVLALGYLQKATTYDDVEDEELREFLDSEKQERRRTITTNNFDRIID